MGVRTKHREETSNNAANSFLGTQQQQHRETISSSVPSCDKGNVSSCQESLRDSHAHISPCIVLQQQDKRSMDAETVFRGRCHRASANCCVFLCLFLASNERSSRAVMLSR